MKVSIKHVGEISSSDQHYLQVLNIILRRVMSALDLDLVRRDYFDSKASKTLPQHKLEVWPGYDTSIRQHEQELLLNCEVKCKVLRTETVYEQVRLQFLNFIFRTK